MRRRLESGLQLIAGIVLMAFLLLFLDLLIYGIILFCNTSEDYPTAEEILPHLSAEGGTYQLDAQETETLVKRQQFAMLLNNDGTILWSESLPEELQRSYTMQDVAKFTRYYLNDYPVRTYVVDEGLLVVGEKTHQVWKYNLEYDVNTMDAFLKISPLLLLFNVVVLVTVPVLIQKRRIRHREEERTEWIAGVSHDIRTPLAIILGNAEFITGSTENASIRKRAELIEAQGIRLRRLVDNLNLSSKLDFGSGKFEKKEVQISRLLRKVLTEIVNQTEDERYQFMLEIDADLQELVLAVNEDLTERTVFNLILNAVKHNEKGCRIDIKLHRDHKEHIFLEIKDNGEGVSEALLDALNRKSYAWETSTGQHGLGLKIVKQVAGWHHWKISFESQKDSGFVCRIRLR